MLPPLENFQKKNFKNGDVPRNVGTDIEPHKTHWKLGWNERDGRGDISRHHYDREFATNRPNMKQFLCIEDPRNPFFPMEAAKVSLEEIADEIYPFLERTSDALPSAFHKSFCMTGLANRLVFTVEGFKQTRTQGL